MEIKTLNKHHLQSIMQISKQQFSDGWTTSQMEEGLMSENYICLGVFEEENLCCYCLALNSLDDINILTIATEQSYKRKGMASAIVNKLSQMAQNQSKTLSLEVKDKNFAAIAFYEKMGFKKQHIRKKYYKDGSDAIIYFKFL
ncbi:MAG: ribosomal protein S18-alanine N-acetyltransferase [Clostridia bacterium]|nr:ribosomal protein S18-alanine N-acetyltransferase [Clostridia bacterium]